MATQRARGRRPLCQSSKGQGRYWRRISAAVVQERFVTESAAHRLLSGRFEDEGKRLGGGSLRCAATGRSASRAMGGYGDLQGARRVDEFSRRGPRFPARLR